MLWQRGIKLLDNLLQLSLIFFEKKNALKRIKVSSAADVIKVLWVKWIIP